MAKSKRGWGYKESLARTSPTMRLRWTGQSRAAFGRQDVTDSFSVIVAQPLSSTFQAAAPPGIAVLTTSSTLFRRSAPEQGT